MSDEVNKEGMEAAISEKLDGVDLSSPEAMHLSAQLAKELGFELNSGPTPTPEQKEMLDELKGKPSPSPDAQLSEALDELQDSQEYFYERDDGSRKSFNSREDYLEYKIGADANKWADKFKALESKLESRGEQPQQAPAAKRPEELLFEDDVLNDENWSPVTKVMAKAFEKFYALHNQELQGKFDSLNNQFGELKMSATESAVRSEFGIDRATEQQILDKQPAIVRDGLANLDPAARLAVIRQLKGQSEEAAQAPAARRAVSPIQAHVESSARGEPDRDPEAAFFEKFTKASEKDQLGLLGQLYKSDQSLLK